jgi:hypothetical protein
MPALRRTAPPLLRTVNGKRHATDNDHEEDLKAPAPKRRSNIISKLTKQQEEDAINAPPQSSDDELQKPTIRPARPLKAIIPVSKGTEDTDLKRPQKSSRKKPDLRRTAHGGLDDDKENTSQQPTSSSGSAAGSFDFGMQYASQGSNKSARTFGSKKRTINIHAPPRKPGAGPAKGALRTTGKRQYGSKARLELESSKDHDSDDSDVSLKSITKEDGEDPELHVKVIHTKRNREADSMSKVTPLDDAELSSLLQSSSRSEDTASLTKPSRSARLLGQLGDWMETREPKSSQPDAGASQEALEEINEYIQRLPNDEEETRCTLCKEPVQLEDHWAFWKGKDQTVKNQEAFCFAHRVKTAQEEYAQSDFPEIDWTALPQRIRRNRMTLFQILRNDRQSQYRDRYEPLALSGKAAAVPSRRRDLPENIQEELESYALDDQSTYPGYYGPHGRRVITEQIMKILKNEIKNCKDAVVQSSGPAAFVQAVLVPEAAILLIMEDCKVDRDRAEEIREQTYDMGMLLNEEIEDEVEAQHESDDENEYRDK